MMVRMNRIAALLGAVCAGLGAAGVSAQPARIEPAQCVFHLVRAPADVPPAPRAALSGACETASRIAYQTVESSAINEQLGKATGRMRAVFEDVARQRNAPAEIVFEVERGVGLGSASSPARCEFVEQRVIVCKRQ